MKMFCDMLSWTKNIVISLNAKCVHFIEKIADTVTGTKNAEDLYNCYFLFQEGIRGHHNRSKKVYNMLDRVIEFIDDAKESIDMCFYLITERSIVDALVRAKERNVQVRIITDYTSGIINNKFAKFFYIGQFPVYVKRANPGHTIMHHKFAIKDDDTVFLCSMNLTKNTTKGSFDNVLISQQEEDVQPFKEQFEFLTQTFERTLELPK